MKPCIAGIIFDAIPSPEIPSYSLVSGANEAVVTRLIAILKIAIVIN
jgi:hypothetical protein